MELKWLHSDQRRQWELVRDDLVCEPQVVGFVTDEFLTRSALSTGQLRELLAKRARVPLPDEAFAD